MADPFDDPFDSMYIARQWAQIALSIAGCVSLCAGCGKYAEPLNSATDLRGASPSIEMVAVPDLPLADYPLLGKFRNLRTIQFYKQGSQGGTDAKMRALAALSLPSLEGVVLLDCRSVTDKGVQD